VALGASGADFEEEFRRVKASSGPDLVVWGSSTITPTLISSGLADEVVLLVYPVVLGTGKRFFAGEGANPRGLKLASSKAGASGVVINVFRGTEALRTGSFGKRD
jgi:dihydrofolate reductase